MSITARSLTLCLLACTAASVSASEVRVWGDTAVIDTYDTTRAILTVPAGLAGKDVISIKSAQGFAMALTSDKQVFAWGKEAATGLFTIPTAVQGHAVQIEALSGSGACALLDSGVVVAWGFDLNAQVTQAPTGAGFAGIGRGELAGIAWTSAGVPSVWGQDAPSVPGSTNVIEAIALRDGVVYRRLSDNQVMSFGAMGFYPSLVPPVPAITAAKLVVGVGMDALFAIRANGTVTAWGSNTTGLLTPPVGLSGVTQVAGGFAHALARQAGGSVTTWGDGVTTDLSIPSNVVHTRLIAAGRGFSIAVSSQSPTAVAWLEGGQAVTTAPTGTVVGRLRTLDEDIGDTFSYALVTGIGDTDNVRFSIVGDSIRVAVGLPAAPTSLTLRLRSTDDSGLAIEAPLTVVVTAAPVEEGSDSKGTFGCGLGGGISLMLVLSLGLFRLRREPRR